MVGLLVNGKDSGSDLESRAFLFRVVIRSKGLRSEGGYFFIFLVGLKDWVQMKIDGSFSFCG